VVCVVRWCLVIPIVVAEGGGDPRERSVRLTEGHSWEMFGMLLLIVTAPFILGLLLVVLGPAERLVSALLGLVLPLGLLVSFGAVLLAVSYQLLRSEKEGDPTVVEVFR
jgi:hypothetical protein